MRDGYFAKWENANGYFAQRFAKQRRVTIKAMECNGVALSSLVMTWLQIRKFENLETDEERIKAGRDVYDQFIMKELLAQSHVRTASLACFAAPFRVFLLCWRKKESKYFDEDLHNILPKLCSGFC